MSEHCAHCGNELPVNKPGALTVGYGRTPDNKKVCFACCAFNDAQWMRRKGQIALYLTIPEDVDYFRRGQRHGERYCRAEITNWPGSLKFRSGMVKYGRHNIAGIRWDVWFDGPDGHVWHGVSIGHNTQILHCKRTKERIG